MADDPEQNKRRRRSCFFFFFFRFFFSDSLPFFRRNISRRTYCRKPTQSSRYIFFFFFFKTMRPIYKTVAKKYRSSSSYTLYPIIYIHFFLYNTFKHVCTWMVCMRAREFVNNNIVSINRILSRLKLTEIMGTSMIEAHKKWIEATWELLLRFALFAGRQWYVPSLNYLYV